MFSAVSVLLAALEPRTSGHHIPEPTCTLAPPVAGKASVSLLGIRGEGKPGPTSHQVWTPGQYTASLWVQAWQVAQKPGCHLSPRVPRPHGRWAQPWVALSWLRAQQRSAGSELPPFVLAADMEKTPKAQSPSQFHHKYPDRVSGAGLIVQALAAACRKPRCQRLGATGWDRKRPGAPGGLCRPALRPGCRHVEGRLPGLGRLLLCSPGWGGDSRNGWPPALWPWPKGQEPLPLHGQALHRVTFQPSSLSLHMTCDWRRPK